MKLISIIGMSRSGTSWLGKIFASHPDTLYHFEPFNLKDERQHLPESLRYWNALERARAENSRDILWKAIQAFWTVKDHTLDRKPFLPQNASPLATMVIKDPGMVAVADKMGYFGGVVIIVRDPRAMLNSLLNHTRFGRTYGIQATAERWAARNDVMIRLAENLPETYSLIKFEDLAESPEIVIKPVMEKFGLAWCKPVEKFIRESQARHDSWHYGVHKDKNIALNRWKDELSAGAQRTILKAVKDSEAAKLYQF